MKALLRTGETVRILSGTFGNTAYSNHYHVRGEDGQEFDVRLCNVKRFLEEDGVTVIGVDDWYPVLHSLLTPEKVEGG